MNGNGNGDGSAPHDPRTCDDCRSASPCPALEAEQAAALLRPHSLYGCTS